MSHTIDDGSMLWHTSRSVHPGAIALADRHYSRVTVGASEMMPPGRRLVLLTAGQDAVWGTSWPYAQYVNRAWKSAWLCSIFRNESEYLSSILIRQAIAATRWKYGEPPEEGMITMIDADKVRRKRDPGRCFLRAGFEHVGYTKKKGLIVLQILAAAMPPPLMPIGAQLPLMLVGT